MTRRGVLCAGGALLVGLGLLASVTCAAAPCAPLVVINESPSVPRGVYLRRPDRQAHLGALVTVAQPRSTRAYLAGLGAPADLPLLKRVAAVGGERICVTHGVLQTPRAVARILARDRRGVRLPAWSGCRTLGDDEVLLLGDGPLSFDGRYFGPVARSSVQATYKELVRW